MSALKLPAATNGYEPGNRNDGAHLSNEYRQYMRSLRWSIKRTEALERAGHRCELCDDHRELEVHHLTYDRFRRERPDDLLVVCKTCHVIADDIRAGWDSDYEEWFESTYPYRIVMTSSRRFLREYVDHLFESGEHPHQERDESWWQEHNPTGGTS